MPDGQMAPDRDGKKVEKIALEEAPGIAAELGLPVPTRCQSTRA